MPTKDEVLAPLPEYGLSHLADEIEPLILPSVRITYAEGTPLSRLPSRKPCTK